MAEIQQLYGTETGAELMNKLNHNFNNRGGGIGSFAMHVKMERGGLKTTGAMDYTKTSFNGSVRSSMFIKVNDATKVVGVDFHGFKVYEYGESHNILSINTNEGDTFNSSTRYIKILKETMDATPEKVEMLFNGYAEEVYNVQIESGTSGGHLKAETLVFDVSDGICTTARLLLPFNYTTSGKKVPLILWCACDGSYSSWDFYIDAVGSNPSVITEQLQYLADQGFAVLNVYPWGSYNNTNFPNCGKSGAVPVPFTLRAYEKAVEYVTTRFNISDTNIFITSWSGSGKLSAYYAIHHPSFNLRHIYAFSPVVDGGVWRMCETLGGANGFRGATNSEMSFDGTTEQIRQYKEDSNSMPLEDALAFKKLNASKFSKFSSIQWQNLVGSYIKDGVLHNHDIDDKVEDSLNWGETWRTYTGYVSPNGVPASFNDWDGLRSQGIYNRHYLAIMSSGVPITIIGAEDDGACPYLAMEQFIIQLQNGGAEAKIINLPIASSADYGNGHSNASGHSAPIFYNQVVSGIGYGWWYAVQDIKARFLKD